MSISAAATAVSICASSTADLWTVPVGRASTNILKKDG